MDDQQFADAFRRSREGDSEAMQEIVLATKGPALSAIQRHFGAKARRAFAPEDVLQETYAYILRRMGDLPSDLKFQEFRVVVVMRARRMVVDMLKVHKEQNWSRVSSFDQPAGTESIGPVTRDDEIVRIRRAIEEMGDPYREVVRRNLIHHESCHRIAVALGRDYETVRKQCARGRRQLAEKLGVHVDRLPNHAD